MDSTKKARVKIGRSPKIDSTAFIHKKNPHQLFDEINYRIIFYQNISAEKNRSIRMAFFNCVTIYCHFQRFFHFLFSSILLLLSYIFFSFFKLVFESCCCV